MAKDIVDLTDLMVTPDEAMDLLGDLIPTAATGLFGDKPKKLSKPRPKWQVDGFTILSKECTCRTCGSLHADINPLLLVSESYVDHTGRVLKSHKTAHPENLRHQNLDFDTLDINTEVIKMADIDFCSSCPTDQRTILTAFASQRKSLVGRGASQDDAEKAEQDLLDLIAKLDEKTADEDDAFFDALSEEI